MSENNGILLKNRVRELRTQARLRQSDLAQAVDVTRQTILAIEKGRLNPSILLGLKIAQVLGEPVGRVFFLDKAPIVSLSHGAMFTQNPPLLETEEVDRLGVVGG